jgi:hypothetical protein
MKKFTDYVQEVEFKSTNPVIGDTLDIIINEELAIETEVVESNGRAIVIQLDETALTYIAETRTDEAREEVDKWAQAMYDEIEERHGWAVAEQFEDIYYVKDVEQIEDARLNVNALQLILKTLKSVGPRDDYAEDWEKLVGLIEEYIGPKEVDEAKYQGREVKLGKPMPGDVKKYKVYVKNPKTGKVKKVNFGDKHMEIKRDNPARRKNFRARHNCSDKKDRTKAGYWSCRMWSKKPVSKIMKGK